MNNLRSCGALALAALALLAVLSIPNDDVTPELSTSRLSIASEDVAPTNVVVERTCYHKECATLANGQSSCHTSTRACESIGHTSLTRNGILGHQVHFADQELDEKHAAEPFSTVVVEGRSSMGAPAWARLLGATMGKLTTVKTAKASSKKPSMVVKMGKSPLNGISKTRKEKIMKFQKRRMVYA